VRVLVDTCVLSEVRHPKGDPVVRERFEALADESIYLSVITIGELTKGIEKLQASKKKTALKTWLSRVIASAGGRILSVDLETAVIWGEIVAKAEAKGRQIAPIDGVIAATAIQHGLHLMTRNVSDFEPTDAMLINPWEDAQAGG
jgi:predicted nucleic acid-binding protein